MKMLIWAVSSFGRALPWHGRGEEFDSPTVHREFSLVVHSPL